MPHPVDESFLMLIDSLDAFLSKLGRPMDHRGDG